MLDGQSTFGQAKSMTRSEQVRSQRQEMFDKARTSMDKKANLSAALKNSQDNAKSARTLGGLLNMFKSQNSIENIRLRRRVKVEEIRHNKQIKSLEAVEKAIKKLSIGVGGGLGGRYSAPMPGGGNRYRDPKTGRFISRGAAARMGAMGFLGRAGVVGLAAGGAYYSTKAIRGNQGKKFFEGGINSRAAGYAGNTLSGAAGGAAIGSMILPGLGTLVGGLVGAGAGIAGSLYADFKEEIDSYLMKKWGGLKKMASNAGASIMLSWKNTQAMFGLIGNRAKDLVRQLPFADEVNNWFAENVNFSSAWGSITGFFSNVSGVVDTHLTNTIPAYGVVKEWGERTLGPWVEKTWTDIKRGMSQFIADAWSWASERLPISTKEGQGVTRRLLNEKKTSAQKQQIVSNAAMTSLYQSRNYASNKVAEYEKLAAKAKSKGKMKDYDKYMKKAKEYGGVLSMVEGELSGRFDIGISPRPGVKASGPSMVGGTYLPKAMQLAGGRTAGATELSNAKQNYSAASAVAGARLEASRITGADFGYLMALAKKESTFNPNAIPINPKTGEVLSSARGNDQFLVGTWNDLVDQEGYKYGMKKETVLGRDSSGKRIWSDTQRKDPKNSAIMAGLLANKDAKTIQKLLGRPPFPHELYIFHFFGETAGKRFLKNWSVKPTAKAAPDFKNQATSNPHIFYSGEEALTYQQVYEKLSKGFTTGDTLAFSQVYGDSAVNAVGGSPPPMPTNVAANSDLDRSKYAKDYQSRALRSLVDAQKTGRVSPEQAANIQRAIGVATNQIAAGNITPEQAASYSTGDITRKIGGYVEAVQGSNISAATTDYVSPSTQAQIIASTQRDTQRAERKEPSATPAPNQATPVYQQPDAIGFAQSTDAGLVVLNMPGI